MPDPQFPIYCNGRNGVHAFMIISENQVLTITNKADEVSIAITNSVMEDHQVFDAWNRGELVESNAKDFNFHRIETNNRLISIGVSEKTQPEKSES